MVDLLIVNGSLSDGTRNAVVAIDQGVIVGRGPGLVTPAAQTLDAQGGLIIPGFVESHMHLDVALMNDDDRPGRAASFVSPAELNREMEERRLAFTREDIEGRATRALAMAARHGITALRAQCHVDATVGLTHLEALLAVRERARAQVDLQIVAFPQQGLLDQPRTLDIFREALRLGADVMGCASNLDPRVATAVDARRHVDTALALAMEHGVDLDLHADMGLPEHVGLEDLETVYAARRALEVGYRGRMTAGHVCALDSAEPEVVAAAIDVLREARMSVISQPDLYRLGRADRRGVRRGLTRVRQLLAGGVNVAFASNNVRDAFRPLGNLNLLEEGLILAYGAHMDTVADLEALMRMCTVNAAKALRLERYGLEVGDAADLVVLDAPTPSAALVGQAEKRFVLKRGRVIAASGCVSELQLS
jgi:cytosine deaminase